MNLLFKAIFLIGNNIYLAGKKDYYSLFFYENSIGTDINQMIPSLVAMFHSTSDLN